MPIKLYWKIYIFSIILELLFIDNLFSMRWNFSRINELIRVKIINSFSTGLKLLFVKNLLIKNKNKQKYNIFL